MTKKPLRLCATALIIPLALSALAGLGKEMDFGGSAVPQGSADFANASPLLVWAPPWAEIPGPLARDYPDLRPGLVVDAFSVVH